MLERESCAGLEKGSVGERELQGDAEGSTQRSGTEEWPFFRNLTVSLERGSFRESMGCFSNKHKNRTINSATRMLRLSKSSHIYEFSTFHFQVVTCLCYQLDCRVCSWVMAAALVSGSTTAIKRTW